MLTQPRSGKPHPTPPGLSVSRVSIRGQLRVLKREESKLKRRIRQQRSRLTELVTKATGGIELRQRKLIACQVREAKAARTQDESRLRDVAHCARLLADICDHLSDRK